MVVLNANIQSIEIVPEDGGWIVRVTECGKVDEIGFRLETAARSYADCQRFRLATSIHDVAASGAKIVR